MKIHFSNIRRLRDCNIIGTLCNRMQRDGEINCTDDASEVTCKLCQRELAAQQARRSA